jgi:rhodanese-related sulfurtransferase
MLNGQFRTWTLGAALLFGLTAAAPAAGGYRNISVDQLVDGLRRGEVVLINVHVPYEGEIPGTDRIIPYDTVERHREELPADKAAPIVVYCMTGPMGTVAAETLVAMGYRNVMNLSGGMRQWVRSGGRLVFVHP